MLRGVVLRLARRGSPVTVIARDVMKLNGLEREAPGLVHGVSADYRYTDLLIHRIATAIEERGDIDLAILWIHDDAPQALDAIARTLLNRNRNVRLLHVRGSAAAKPDRVDAIENLPRSIAYREVILGFIREHGGSRWLSHAEICDGVLSAIETDMSRSIVGVVTPWGARP